MYPLIRHHFTMFPSYLHIATPLLAASYSIVILSVCLSGWSFDVTHLTTPRCHKEHVMFFVYLWNENVADASYFSLAVVATIRAPFLRHVSFNSGLSAHYTPARVYTHAFISNDEPMIRTNPTRTSRHPPSTKPLAPCTSIDVCVHAGRLWILQITSDDFQCLSSCADTFW